MKQTKGKGDAFSFCWRGKEAAIRSEKDGTESFKAEEAETLAAVHNH